MRPGIRIGNAHGTSVDGWAFFAYVNPDQTGREWVTSGYWQADGRAARIVRGERRTERVGDFAHAVIIEAHDALDRNLLVHGRCVNRQAIDAGHDLYAVLNLVEWTAGDGQRRVGRESRHLVETRLAGKWASPIATTLIDDQGSGCTYIVVIISSHSTSLSCWRSAMSCAAMAPTT